MFWLNVMNYNNPAFENLGYRETALQHLHELAQAGGMGFSRRNTDFTLNVKNRCLSCV